MFFARSGAFKLLADVIHLLSRFDLIYGLKSNVSYFLSIKQAHGSNTIDVDQVVADLLHGSMQKASASLKKPSKSAPLDSKMAGLSELHRVIVQEKSCTSATFLGHLEDMFRGISSCLNTQKLAQLSNSTFPGSVSQSQVSNNNQLSDHIVDIVLKGN